MRAYPGDPPALVGHISFSDLTEAEQIFGLGRLMLRIAVGMAWLDEIPADAGESDPERPLEVLRFQFTSGTKNREPVDKLWRARPGERVYAYVALRNRSGRERKVHVTFRVNGKTRTEVDLDIAESWSYRTWAYNTVLKTDLPESPLGKPVRLDEYGNPVYDVFIRDVVKRPDGTFAGLCIGDIDRGKPEKSWLGSGCDACRLASSWASMPGTWATTDLMAWASMSSGRTLRNIPPFLATGRRVAATM